MGWLDLFIIGVLLAALLLVACSILSNLRLVVIALNKISTDNQTIFNELQGVKKAVATKGGVTDPFVAANKTSTVGASSSHIIVRKSPDQIRSENFEKLRSGQQYGHDS